MEYKTKFSDVDPGAEFYLEGDSCAYVKVNEKQAICDLKQHIFSPETPVITKIDKLRADILFKLSIIADMVKNKPHDGKRRNQIVDKSLKQIEILYSHLHRLEWLE